MSTKLVQVIDALEKRLKVFVDYRKQKEWTFKQGNLLGAEKPDYEDGSWEPISLPYSWKSAGKEAWFRKRIVIPKDVGGVLIEGSKVEVFSTGIMLIPTEVFIDGKKAFSAEHWADFRGPRLLTSSGASPGREHVIVIHTLDKEGIAGIPLMEICYSKVDDVALELASFIEELRFAQRLTGGKELSERAIASIRPEALLTLKPQALLSMINNIRKSLSPLKPLAKEYVIHLIGHAHIDMNWLWPWEETVDICRRDFDTITRLMEEFPDLCFSHSQAATYRIAEEKFPQIFERIKQAVKQRRWDVTASTWVEGDLNMANGEATVHQILYGTGYVKEKFGVEPKICWEPDTFGHPWSIPQILKKSGIDYYYFMRCGKGYPMFWWESPDGSRVLAFNSVYNAFVTPGGLTQLSEDFEKRFGTKTAMFVYGVGDHGGGPTREDIKVAHKLNEKDVFPRLEFSTTERFFGAISREKLNLPVVKDELNFIFDGCYTTHSDIKEHNRKCERLLLEAEMTGSIAKLVGGDYPNLKKSWEKALFNQFHDILDGSAIHISYEYSDKLAEEAEKDAQRAIFNSLSILTKNVDAKQEGLPILVFNPLAWERTDIVNLPLPKNAPASPMVKDEEGKIYPAQVLEDRLLFIASKVPSSGYKVFYIVKGERKDSPIASGESLTLENEFFILEFDRKSGTIASLYDKENGKVVMNRQREEARGPERLELTCPIMNNLLQVLYELPHSMSAWVIGPISSTKNLVKNPEIKLITSGPVVAQIRLKYNFENSTINQDICLYRGVRRIDFVTNVDWRETASPDKEAPMLKVSFTPMLNKTRATFEVPFGHIERVADGREMPALQWVDMSDEEYGLSLLSDTKYGFDISGNTIRMTLARTSYEPDPVPDVREHNLKYALYPHRGSWKDAHTVRKGYELNHPLMGIAISSTGKNLPPEKSFVRVEPSSIITTCLKKAEKSDDLILRIYESKGERTEAKVELGFPVREITETDLLERQIESSIHPNDTGFSFSINPYEIKTFRIFLHPSLVFPGKPGKG